MAASSNPPAPARLRAERKDNQAFVSVSPASPDIYDQFAVSKLAGKFGLLLALGAVWLTIYIALLTSGAATRAFIAALSH